MNLASTEVKINKEVELNLSVMFERIDHQPASHCQPAMADGKV